MITEEQRDRRQELLDAAAGDVPPASERLAEGARLRDEGMAAAEQAADPRLVLTIDQAIEKAIASGRRFSANDIRDQFPVVRSGLVGARMRSYAGRREDGHPLMVKVGYTPSTSPETRNHEIKVWLGWDAHQAINRTA